MRRLPTSDRRFSVDRRWFLRYVASVSAIPWLPQRSTAIEARPRFANDPFSLGVASGDPTSDGVVIWTRLATRPLEPEGGMKPVDVAVRWQVAEDERFSRVVAGGEAVASARLGHSVHVEVTGLRPQRWYFYRFMVGDAESPIGRTRTMPHPDGMPDRLRFAFTSCQHYEHGYFNGYAHMQREDLDLVVHLGDYIYEYGGQSGKVRKHIGKEIRSLDDYRRRYAQYRLDPLLAETHRLFPWLVTWDDHEFDNNYAGVVSEEQGVSPQEFLLRRAAAYQAYYEFMPLRRDSFPHGPHMRLYRACDVGRLVRFCVLDTRQYRTDQPNGDGQKELIGKALDPKATMLGDAQERWLMRQLKQSPATWNVLAQQVMMALLNRGTPQRPLYSMDQWPGYDVSRRRLLRFFHQAKIANPIVLTGDIHTNWVNDLRADELQDDAPVVATEFVGTSLTSGGNGGNRIAEFERAARINEFVRWYNSNRGYVTCDVTPERWTTFFRITPFVDRPGSPVRTAATFIVENGRPGAQRASG